MSTFVQQLDAQGPAVVQRITTQVGGLACSDDTIQQLVEALHSGKSVTITSDANGQKQSATFNASGTHLGYGEAYLALALAAEQLRNAGVSSCATPDQWQAVLLGGPLKTDITSSTTHSVASASNSTQLPGIVTLHRQGQGWGQIAQANNVQLGQIINHNSASLSADASKGDQSLSPTGYSSAEMNRGHAKSDSAWKDKNDKDEKAHAWGRDRDQDKDHKDKDHDVDTKAAPDASPATPQPENK